MKIRFKWLYVYLCYLVYYLLAPSNIFRMFWLIEAKPQKDKRKKGFNFLSSLCEQRRQKGKLHAVEESASGILPWLYVKQSTQSSSLNHKSRGKKMFTSVTAHLPFYLNVYLSSLLQIGDFCCVICSPLELYPFKKLLLRKAWLLFDFCNCNSL